MKSTDYRAPTGLETNLINQMKPRPPLFVIGDKNEAVGRKVITLQAIPKRTLIAEYSGQITFKYKKKAKKTLEDVLLVDTEKGAFVIDPSKHGGVGKYFLGASSNMKKSDRSRSAGKKQTNCAMALFTGDQTRAFLYSVRDIQPNLLPHTGHRSVYQPNRRSYAHANASNPGALGV